MNRVALITGGSRGIGLGIAEQLAGNGFDLAVNGMRSSNETDDVIEKLKSFGSDVIYCRGIFHQQRTGKHYSAGKATLWPASYPR
jgi:NAD(P)-dependent dehydrogenase (short-subunit alcohol dehydrogenase family)